MNNSLDPTREGQEGWIVKNSKLAEEIVENINPSNINEQACINFALDRGMTKADGQKAWQEIFRSMKDLENCPVCLGNGLMPLVGNKCMHCGGSGSLSNAKNRDGVGGDPAGALEQACNDVIRLCDQIKSSAQKAKGKQGVDWGHTGDWSQVKQYLQDAQHWDSNY